MSKQTRRTVFDMRLQGTLATTGAAAPFVKTAVTTAGVPTAVAGATGLVLTLDTNNETESMRISMDDLLVYDIDEIIKVEFLVAAGTYIATDKARFGLAAAGNADPDAIVDSIFFGVGNAGALTVECDDGTNETAATATGITLGSTLTRCVIDLSSGLATNDPPTASTGGKSNIQFSVSNSSGALRRVASGTVFSMAAHTTGLQLYMQLQKTALGVPTLTIKEIVVEHKVEP